MITGTEEDARILEELLRESRLDPQRIGWLRSWINDPALYLADTIIEWIYERRQT